MTQRKTVPWWQDLNSDLRHYGMRRKMTKKTGFGLFAENNVKKGDKIAIFESIGVFFVQKRDGLAVVNDIPDLLEIMGETDVPIPEDNFPYCEVARITWKVLRAARNINTKNVDLSGVRGMSVNQKITHLEKTWFARFWGNETPMPKEEPGMRAFAERDLEWLMSEFPEHSEAELMRIIHVITRTVKPVMFNHPDGGYIGQTYSATFSRLNHSCNSNAVFTCSVNKIVLHAQRDIEAGEEITITYPERENTFECLCGSCDTDMSETDAAEIQKFMKDMKGWNMTLKAGWENNTPVCVSVLVKLGLPFTIIHYIYLNPDEEVEKFIKSNRPSIIKAALFLGIEPVHYLVHCFFGASSTDKKFRAKFVNVIKNFN